VGDPGETGTGSEQGDKTMRTHTSAFRRLAVVATALAALTTAATGCSSDDDDTTSTEAGSSTTAAGGGGDGGGAVLRVPEDHESIQAAVDAAEPGDLVLVGEGGVQGGGRRDHRGHHHPGRGPQQGDPRRRFELENGIRVLDTDGVVVENMTARNYVSNGFYWTGSDRYRGSYLTAYRNGDYGIYAFDAYHGQFDNSYGSGSPDAGFYIGECFECDAVLDNVVSSTTGSATRAPTPVATCTSSTPRSGTTGPASCPTQAPTSSATPAGPT
jgi:hypothetical protein